MLEMVRGNDAFGNYSMATRMWHGEGSDGWLEGYELMSIDRHGYVLMNRHGYVLSCRMKNAHWIERQHCSSQLCSHMHRYVHAISHLIML